MRNAILMPGLQIRYLPFSLVVNFVLESLSTKQEQPANINMETICQCYIDSSKKEAAGLSLTAPLTRFPSPKIFAVLIIVFV